MYKEQHDILIDNKMEVLTFVYVSGGGYQYNTIDNKSAHTFKCSLNAYKRFNKEFKTNGHTYKFL